jgi:hypothetical protein
VVQRSKSRHFHLHFNLLRLVGSFVLALTILPAVRRADRNPS